MILGYVHLAWIHFQISQVLIREQWLNSTERLRVLTNKNVDDICNVVKKPGSKNANRMPSIGQQVSVIAKENLKLAAFLFHQRWRSNLEWEVIRVLQDTVHLLQDRRSTKTNTKILACCLRSINLIDQGQWRPSSQIMPWCLKNTSDVYYK